MRDVAEERHRDALVHNSPRMIARWLSIVFHPFVMVGVMVGAAAAARQTMGDAVRSVGLVMLFTIVPLAVLMWRQVRRGEMAKRRRLKSGRAAHPVYRRGYRARDAARISSAVQFAVVHGPWRGCDVRHDGGVRGCDAMGQGVAAHGVRSARRRLRWRSCDRRSDTCSCWHCRRLRGRASRCSGTRRSK